MLKQSLKNIPYGLIILSALFFCSLTFLKSPALEKRSDYIAPPIVIKNMSAGFNSQLSDSFWLRAVQDFDYCDSPVNEKECVGNSWLFHVLDLTTELDRKFLESYFYGGLALTIIISDYAGATKIYDKGVAEFPNDWPLNYTAGYHSQFVENDKIKASQRYLAAVNNGAPNWVRLSAGRLAAEGGQKEIAEEILKRLIGDNSHPKWIEKLQKKISQIK